MRTVSLAAGLIVLSAPGVAAAQATQSYSYDANGRLVGVATAGPSGTHGASYGYDQANNRTSRTQSGATAWASVSRLPVHRFLEPHEALVSPDGRYSFALRPSGRLELWNDSRPVDAATSRAMAARFATDAAGRVSIRREDFAHERGSQTSVSLTNTGELRLSEVPDEAAVLIGSNREVGQ